MVCRRRGSIGRRTARTENHPPTPAPMPTPTPTPAPAPAPAPAPDVEPSNARKRPRRGRSEGDGGGSSGDGGGGGARDSGEWFLFNDARVTRVSDQAVLRAEAFILLYERQV